MNMRKPFLSLAAVAAASLLAVHAPVATAAGVPGVEANVGKNANDGGVPGVELNIGKDGDQKNVNTGKSDKAGVPGVEANVGKNAKDGGVPGVEMNVGKDGDQKNLKDKHTTKKMGAGKHRPARKDKG
jgi:hypothetical protein